MPTQEERLQTLEQAHKQVSEAVKDVNHYVTMIYGVVGKQEVDLRDIKISIRSLDERLTALEHTVNSRFEEQGQKLDQVLHMLTTLTNKPEQER